MIHTGSWNGEVNAPVLTADMTPVIYDDKGEPVPVTTDDERWFDYGNKQWANAMTQDGSFWVWIPRYEYQIDSENQTISVNFIPTDRTEPSEGYKIHPAFRDGTNNNFMNGEWDKEISGIWVAKYEMSMEENGVAVSGRDVVTSDTIKAVSKPGVIAWYSIGIGNCYTNSYNYAREKESHLMKNSEWGAVAYLTHSPCGTNAEEMYKTILWYTGGSKGATANTNILQSNTGNSLGIHGLRGGYYEQVAGYITNGHSYLKNGSSFVATTEENAEGYKTLSTKYATVYPFNSSNDRPEDNWNQYNLLAQASNGTYGYGDAILETSTQEQSWYDQGDIFAYERSPFFTRGGYEINNGVYKRTGIFNFDRTSGFAGNYGSYRIVLICE